jgi:long-chain fatty acid transport protein
MAQHTPISANKALLFVTLMAAAWGQANAAGFALIEQGASGLGNAYAGAGAVAADASTVFFNPAGMMYLQGNQVAGAVHIIQTSSEFSGTGSLPPALGGTPISGGNGGDAGSTALVPNLFYSQQLANGFVVGLGISVPFGLKTEYDATWTGRYQAIESEVKTININPSIAYKAAPNLSVGVGVSAQRIEATLSQAVNQLGACVNGGGGGLCGALAGSPDALAEIEGDDWSFGYNFGLLYEVAPSTRIGFAYRSKIKQELEGDATFAGAHAAFAALGVLVPTNVKADVTLPESASLSLYHELDSNWALLADATWTRWNRFEELRIDFASNQPDSVTIENWDNSMRYSLGLNYRYNSDWLLRAGIAFDEEAIPDDQHRTPRIPGNDRTWLAFGANYRYSPAITFDVGYAHLFVDDPGSNHTDLSGFNLTGAYDASVDILSAQVNWTF